MAQGVVVLGSSGTGKSASIRTMDPGSTFLIKAVKKMLPWKGSNSSYNEKKMNTICTSNSHVICRYMQAISERRPEIKSIIIDDYQYIMSDEFMDRALERGFDKFTEIASHAFSIFKKIESLRDDLIVYIMCHTQHHDNGEIKLKTVGKLTDEKCDLQGRVSICFYTDFENGEYKFLTNQEGGKLARTPMGMFDDKRIDNDLGHIDSVIREFIGIDETKTDEDNDNE